MGTTQGLVNHLIHVEILVGATSPDEVQSRLATGQLLVLFIDRLIAAVGCLYWVIAFQIIIRVIARLLGGQCLPVGVLLDMAGDAAPIGLPGEARCFSEVDHGVSPMPTSNGSSR